MSKLLSRAHAPWGADHNISEILINNEVGGNTGNVIFLQAVMRTLMTEGTEIETMNFMNRKRITQREVDFCNSEYDAFIIPLANAFRMQFVRELNVISDFIERLTIPCIVAGVGMQAISDLSDRNKAMDDSVRRFMDAVLEKSSIVGLRGELTAEYLKSLGYREEKDYTVIGCPSMYTFGDSLPEPRLSDLTPDSKVSYNYKPTLEREHYDIIRREAGRFHDAVFISQIPNEVRNLYVGYQYAKSMEPSFPPDYPAHLSAPEIAEDRMVGVVDKPSWIEFIKGRDFNFGSRIHGNIVSILAGTPCYIIAGDSRVRELASYHNIPFTLYSDLEDGTTIFDLYEKADYGMLHRGHKDRVSHYLDFFERNGIPHVERSVLNGDDAPFDRIIRNKESLGVIHSFPTVGAAEWERRINEYETVYTDQIRDFKQTQKELKEELACVKRENKETIRALNRELNAIKGSRFWKLRNFCIRVFPGSRRTEI